MMNGKEILFFVEAVANEKGLGRDDVFNALEHGLATAIRKSQKEEMDVRVEIDQQTGAFEAFRCWVVVANDAPDFEEATMLKLMDAEDEDTQDSGSVELGDVLEEPLTHSPIGRIGAQTARQVVMQKLREAGRRKIAEEYEPRVGDVFLVAIKHIERGNIIVDVAEGVEGVLLRESQIPGEQLRIGSLVRMVLFEVDAEVRGPQLFFSRTENIFLERLFEMEVPEIGDGIIDVKGIARDPGVRAKVAVHTGDPHLDVVGACVGMRGARVQSIMKELAGERIDIVKWSSDAAQFVIHAMSPAEIVSLSIDEDTRSIDLSIKDDMLSQAIGRSGQNIRLASQLTGWILNAFAESEFAEKENISEKRLIEHFVEQLGISEEQASKIIAAGLVSLEAVLYSDEAELVKISGLNEEEALAVRDRINDILLMQMLSDGEEAGVDESAEDEEAEDIT